ncbi:hypothetical protein NQ315_008026 [Exocentrus adspersus]|uniref:Uncharacterized protein n=1 Tax=Exocentrus adspersus TaxID=1586481 RepID=A0AAV8VVQ2_9CUCU|nr:hypothetical protein NQ315_008026 [Exocentrus adspersus]
MVAEESCTLSSKICNNQSNECDKNWLSDGITMSVAKSQNDNTTEADDNRTSNNNDNRVVDDEAIRTFIEELISDICDSAINKIESRAVMTRDRKLNTEELYLRKANRRTSILDDELQEPIECRNNFLNVNHLHRRSVSESVIDNCVVDENDNNDYFKVPEAKKRNQKIERKSFPLVSLRKKEKSNKVKDHKNEEDSETHDNLPQLPIFRSNTLGKSKKYSSAMELHQPVPATLHRTPSFIKKLVHISEDSSKFLKRSWSFRDLNKNKVKVPVRETLKEKKNQEWKQSLQSLVENDVSVSYNDLSFINYDALNNINYKEQDVHLSPGTADTRGGYIGRTQSMIEKNLFWSVSSPDYEGSVDYLVTDTHPFSRFILPVSSVSSFTSSPESRQCGKLIGQHINDSPIVIVGDPKASTLKMADGRNRVVTEASGLPEVAVLS